MKVICVDTDIWELRKIKKLIQKLRPNADVKGCHNPNKAIRLAAKNGCDVLVTEIEVGRTSYDGIMLAQKMKENNPCLNIVFVTYNTDSCYACNAWTIPACDYIVKPYPAERIEKAFEHLRYTIK